MFTIVREENKRKKTGAFKNMWKLNNMFLDNQRAQESRKNEVKKLKQMQ